MSGTKGIFCDFDSGVVNKCKDSTEKCRTPGNAVHGSNS